MFHIQTGGVFWFIIGCDIDDGTTPPPALPQKRFHGCSSLEDEAPFKPCSFNAAKLVLHEEVMAAMLLLGTRPVK